VKSAQIRSGIGQVGSQSQQTAESRDGAIKIGNDRARGDDDKIAWFRLMTPEPLAEISNGQFARQQTVAAIAAELLEISRCLSLIRPAMPQPISSTATTRPMMKMMRDRKLKFFI
jgi:hypothetical protein